MRYAVYFVPRQATPLYRFGASVLGYDCYAGNDIPFVDGVDPVAWPALVRAPRIYGFHATLKPPFRLADGATADDLAAAAARFAEDHLPIRAGGLAVRALGAFVALVPTSACPALDRLAGACVAAFEPFRAPMTREERERRLAAGLSPRQIENLNRWGYPYVFEDFRFHMTLTGPLPAAQRESISRFLCEKLEQSAAAQTLILDQIAVAGQAGEAARFRVLHCASLGQSPYHPYAYSF